MALLLETPRLIAEALQQEDAIRDLAPDLAKARDVLYLGRGVLYPLAMEGALKLKELSYIHAEGYAAGELKHGPIALVDENMPVVVAAPSGELLEKTLSNLQEVAARGGSPIILITDEGGRSSAHAATKVVLVPACDPLIAPMVYAIPIQLLAYHVAVQKGTDVDQPRNLAKSVTVE
ncbi:MAG: SIS domain-containing protein [Caulobacteraceae bacterium]